MPHFDCVAHSPERIVFRSDVLARDRQNVKQGLCYHRYKLVSFEIVGRGNRTNSAKLIQWKQAQQRHRVEMARMIGDENKLRRAAKVFAPAYPQPDEQRHEWP